MIVYKFTVPPTMEQGSYSGLCGTTYGLSKAGEALYQYNSSREHDGLPPIKRMPKGTKYIKIVK